MEIININFYPNIGLGEIPFSWNEKDIIKKLGIPDERSIYEYDDSEYAVCLYYHKLELNFWIHYENNSFSHLSIHINNIILDGVKLSLLEKNELLKFIKDFHIKNRYEYSVERTYNSDVNEEFYDFTNIGISIWFENDSISDISLQMSINLRFSKLN